MKNGRRVTSDGKILAVNGQAASITT
jgi:hypothetical protein